MQWRRRDRQTQRWSAAFAEIAGVAGFVVDGEGILRFVTGGLAPDPDALEGRPVAELFPDDPGILTALDAARHGELPSGEVRLARDGRVLESRIRIDKDRDGRVSAVHGVCVDITERVRAEERLATDRRFLAAVSHELRTPLNGVLGFAELLGTDRSGELNERQRRYVGNVAKAGRHMLALINDLLDQTAIEFGRLSVELQSFPISDAIEDAVSSVSCQFESKGITFATHVDRSVAVLADRRRAMQVLLNLLANAAHHTPGGGRVWVETETDKGMVEVRVADTGAGIPAEDLERIFQPFEQVDPQRAAEKLGSGLGLALSRQFVVAMGGSLTVESALGRGSTFTLALPESRD